MRRRQRRERLSVLTDCCFFSAVLLLSGITIGLMIFSSFLFTPPEEGNKYEDGEPMGPIEEIRFAASPLLIARRETDIDICLKIFDQSRGAGYLTEVGNYNRNQWTDYPTLVCLPFELLNSCKWDSRIIAIAILGDNGDCPARVWQDVQQVDELRSETNWEAISQFSLNQPDPDGYYRPGQLVFIPTILKEN